MVLDRSSVLSLTLARVLRLVALASILVWPASADDRLVELELTIDEGTVDFTGTPVRALTVDGGIPGPTLRFTEGDVAHIHVHNRLDVPSSIHWHGLLVPPGMDGVPFISFPPIAPGSTFTYEFPIRQSGTYWYHSHSELQEQVGVYGAIVIEPAGAVDAVDQTDRDTADQDHVVLFSDWTDRDPHEVLRDLKRGNEWAAVERGIAQSILGARREGRLGDYFWRELQRMPPMDIADIAYDRFLANGRPAIELPAAAGETVRLRLIDGSASTVFHVEFAGGPMTVVAADGQDVEPFTLDRLMIAVAETYDVLVTVPADGSFELRATSHDGSGHASVWLGDGPRRAAPDVPWPNMYVTMGKPTARQVFALTPFGAMNMPDEAVERGAFDAPGMNMGRGSMDMSSMQSMEKGSMDMSSMQSMGKGSMDHASMDASPQKGSMDASPKKGSMAEPASSSADVDPSPYGDDFGWLATDLSSRKPLARDGGAERPWPPYDRLRARRSTALPADLPVREVRLTLDGDMERYVWFLDQTPLSASDAIKISEGEIVRFRMINRTMMHHPMHLHGHFFRVVDGQGDRAPLKHTVNVEPMSTTVIEFEANEVGDWFFHCHLLYHMKTGMARVVSYENFTPPPEVQAVRPLLYRESWYAWSDVALMSHRSEGAVVAVDTLNTLRAEWEVGWQDVDETETELTLTWERYRNRFFSWFLGVDVEAEGSEVDDPRAILGLRYLVPFGIETQLWVDSDGEGFLGLEKMFHLTPRLAIELEAQYETRGETDGGWEESVTLEYVLTRRLDLLAQWHSENGLGGGVMIRF